MNYDLVCRIENILAAGPPSYTDWWETGSDDDAKSTQQLSKQQRQKQFRNCGLETWLQVQQSWKIPLTYTQQPTAPCPSKSVRNELKRGLGNGVKRTYALPQKVGLKDMVDILNEMWHEEEDQL
jgi:hypothetical protein